MKGIFEAAQKLPSWMVVSGFFIVISVLVMAPYLFFGRLILSTDSDALYYYYPAFDFLSKALKSGESFLWNPHLFSGFPMYLSQSAGFLDPLNWLIFSWFPAIEGYHVRLLIDFVLTMTASYAAARAFSVSRLASLLVGPAYLVSFHWRFLSNVVIANSLFLLPFLFFLYAKIRSSQYRWWSGGALGGFALGWVFITGYAQMAIYALLLLALFAFVDSLWRERSQRVTSFFGSLSFLATVSIVGLVVGLPQILPALSFTPLTVRSGGLEFAATTLKSIKPGDLVLFLFPDYLYFPYISAGRKPLFIGAFWFMMAFSALFLFWRKREVRLFGIVFAFSFLASLAYSPLFYLIQKLPVLEYFRFPYRWMYLGTWFLSMLAAFGFDLIRDYSPSVKARRVWIAIGALTAILSLGVLFFPLIHSPLLSLSPFLARLFPFLGFAKEALHYQDAIQRGLLAWEETIALSRVPFLVPFLLLVAAVGLMIAYVTNKVTVRLFRKLGALLVLFTFFGIFMVQWSPSVKKDITRSYGALLESYTPAEERVMYRTYPFMLDRGFREHVPPQFILDSKEQQALTELQHAAGWPNMHIYSGISSIDGYDPFVSREYLARLAVLGSSHGGEDATRGISESERINRLYANLSLLGDMSGKYIISGVPLEHPKLAFLGSRAVSSYQVPLYLYRNADARPRFYLSDSLNEEVRGKVIPTSPTRAGNGYFEFKLDIQRPQWLVVAESNLPGWEASIDGKSVNISRAKELYMAIEISPGIHTVVFSYKGMLGELNLLQRLGLVHF